jgi:hypothetical protein
MDYGISNKIMNNGIAEPMISSENVGIVILLIISAVVHNIWRKEKTL